MLHHEHGPDGLRRVVLVAGRGNALGSRLLAEIENAFDPGLHEPGPVVLAGRGRSFCTGLDLVMAAGLDRQGMRDLMERFHRALRAVLVWPGAVVAEIQGHALAGGALLALCADRRLMAHGEARFGIHGVQLGVVYPQIAIEVLRWRLDRRLVEQTLYGGRILPGHEALEQGLVDGLADADRLQAEAAALAAGLLPLARTKAAVLEGVRPRVAVIDPAGMESWLDRWFHPETRERVAAAREALLSRRGIRPGEPATDEPGEDR
jgi:enoyl-CoA hydratase